ncbi:DUF1868 domain-containing protein [Pelistega ratti]|uniref:DUF1868 domain-containing protein n=1 Tax=Pelistega ratti TaxID=2652177 RepID=UPI001358414B|nr:DUF1868 domain-containing protein [Pelistega ratti]
MDRRSFLGAAALLSTSTLLATQATAQQTRIAQNEFLPTVGKGYKFDFDGQALHYPGNSLVSHVPQDTSFYQNLVELQQEIKQSEFGELHTFLPKNSFHITLFNGTNENPAQREKEGFWPRDLPKTASIEDVHLHYAQKLKQFKPDLPKVLKFAPTELWGPFDKEMIILGVELVEGREQIIEFRRQLSELLQTTRNQPDKFRFHITLAYNWKKYTPEQLERAETQRKIWSTQFKQQNPLLEVDTIEFAIFDDMLAYAPLVKYHLNTL